MRSSSLESASKAVVPSFKAFFSDKSCGLPPAFVKDVASALPELCLFTVWDTLCTAVTDGRNVFCRVFAMNTLESVVVRKAI